MGPLRSPTEFLETFRTAQGKAITEEGLVIREKCSSRSDGAECGVSSVEALNNNFSRFLRCASEMQRLEIQPRGKIPFVRGNPEFQRFLSLFGFYPGCVPNREIFEKQKFRESFRVTRGDHLRVYSLDHFGV